MCLFVHLQVLQHLIQFKIDTTIKDDQGKKAEDYARSDVDDDQRKHIIEHCKPLKERISNESLETGNVIDIVHMQYMYILQVSLKPCP